MTNEERDLAIRTIAAEAGKSPEQQLAVANVIRNRVASGNYGDGIGGVVTKKYAFEPMLHYGTGRDNDPARFNEGEPVYQQAARIFDSVMAGGAPDNTNGSTHFIAKGAQTAMGRDIPSWAKGQALATIGGQSYYAPEGQVDSTTIDPNNPNSPALALAQASTPQGSDAANRFLSLQGRQQQLPGSPGAAGGGAPTPGQFGPLADLFKKIGASGGMAPAAGAATGGSNVPFLQRMIWGDKGFNGVLDGVHTPNDGQGLLGHLFGGPSQFPTPPGATAPTAPAGDTGAALTAPVMPVQSSPLAPPGGVPLPPPRPGGAAMPDLTANAMPIAAPSAAAPIGTGFDGALSGAAAAPLASAAPLAAAAPAAAGAGAGLAGAAGAAGGAAAGLGPLSALFAMI